MRKITEEAVLRPLEVLTRVGWANMSARARPAPGAPVGPPQGVALIDLTEDRDMLTQVLKSDYEGNYLTLPQPGVYIILTGPMRTGMSNTEDEGGAWVQHQYHRVSRYLDDRTLLEGLLEEIVDREVGDA